MTLKEGQDERIRQHKKRLGQELERIRSLLPSLGIQKAILFGSLARGDRVHSGTDIDLALIADSPLPWSKRQNAFYERIVPCGADILVYTPDEFEEMRQRPFGRRLLREGKVLYESQST